MITGNEPAMPLDYDLADTTTRVIALGLTIRQHFAAIAMQGFIASFGGHDLTHIDDIAHDSVMAADALIAELNKTEK